MTRAILLAFLLLAACEAVPTPASQGFDVVSVGGHPVSYYRAR